MATNLIKAGSLKASGEPHDADAPCEDAGFHVRPRERLDSRKKGLCRWGRHLTGEDVELC